jgi:hypothetical protein
MIHVGWACCPATMLCFELVSVFGVFGRYLVQITAGVQTIQYDMVLAFPPSACGPATLSNRGSLIYSGIIIKQTP